MRTGSLLLLLLAFCGGAAAQHKVIEVTTLREPVTKSYRRMIEGVEHFESERRRLAPAATLRFRLLPRKADTPMEGVELQVAGESVALPVKIAPDRSFVLERNPVALAENAEVVPNRKAGTMTWRSDVRTPGLPPHTRRLGDLRLECEVGMKAGLISEYPAGFFGWVDSLLRDTPAYCRRAAPRYLFFAERAIFGVTLSYAGRREVLPVDMLYGGASRDPQWKYDRHCDCEALFDRAYFLPLGDDAWPNDTVVELEYMDTGPPGKTTKADALAAFGKATVLDFASGYEVWVYRGRAQEKPPGPSPERVLLFAPSGFLQKTRIR